MLLNQCEVHTGKISVKFLFLQVSGLGCKLAKKEQDQYFSSTDQTSYQYFSKVFTINIGGTWWPCQCFLYLILFWYLPLCLLLLTILESKICTGTPTWLNQKHFLHFYFYVRENNNKKLVQFGNLYTLLCDRPILAVHIANLDHSENQSEFSFSSQTSLPI